MARGRSRVTTRASPAFLSLKVMAGASAGGMSVAIAAAQLCEAHVPAADPRPPGPPNNKLFRSRSRAH